MQIRAVGMFYVFLFGTFAVVTAAYAGEYGGYGASESDTQEIGSDPNTGAATPEDYQNMESTQQQIQDQKDTYGGVGAQQDAVEGGDDQSDDEDGH